MTITTEATTDRWTHEETGSVARWTGSGILVDVTRPLSDEDLRQLWGWAGGVAHDAGAAHTPIPDTGCPEWCTAVDSIDPWVRKGHEWEFLGPSMWIRHHHGPGTRPRWRLQAEVSEPDGTSVLRRIERGREPKRRELRDGYWWVVQDDGSLTAR